MEENYKTFAIIKNGIVENAIIGESFEILSALVPDATLIEQTDKTGPIFINGTFDDGIFFSEKPYASWVKNREMKCWDPPKEYPSSLPDGHYAEWNEDKVDWDFVKIPIAD
jgi:hypothetical protein